MWTIKRIDEADFGCEERLPGEPLMVLVSLESDDGRVIQFETADNWLTVQELSEGDDWPEDIEMPDAADERTARQNQWMENYFEALEELEQDDVINEEV